MNQSSFRDQLFVKPGTWIFLKEPKYKINKSKSISLILGGGENVLIRWIFGFPLLIVALISIEYGDIFRFTKKCGFTPYQWPWMN